MNNKLLVFKSIEESVRYYEEDCFDEFVEEINEIKHFVNNKEYEVLCEYEEYTYLLRLVEEDKYYSVEVCCERVYISEIENEDEIKHIKSYKRKLK